ncbi:DNA polymerase IV [Fulvivirgaceae bacterium BMA10]|uniref:DNA polymerase IV n=1 Tax=Splendidivirga corallicola TaxID=3051826 RepID=A0ABT8KPH7_9BACT|nr:DNA polymerase IV [Fulvivirgaceae bacterium BMA10]
MNTTTKIIHIDMDAFYASVEQRDNPSLRGKPVAVGGSSQRGVVAAASYEARKYGVHSAMPSVTAFRKCPDIIFVRPRFEIYKEVSQQIREIFHEYTDLVEPLSLDEAYLDVTVNKKNIPSATLIAKEIKKRIKETTSLTASAGISINKFLAKTASDLDKPDGLSVILPKDAEAFVEKLPINKFHGIGKVTAKKMNGLGIYHGADLKRWSENDLVTRFGKAGTYYYKIARAQDDRKVNPNRIRKSVSSEDTFEKDLTTYEEMLPEAQKLAEKVFSWTSKNKKFGKTLTLKIKFSDFKIITRSKTTIQPIDTLETMMRLLIELLNTLDYNDISVRLIGVGISNFDQEPEDHIGKQMTIEF